MAQLLLIAVFVVLVLPEAMTQPWLRADRDGLVAAIAVGSMAGLWLVSHAAIWLQGRRMDRRGDLRAVGRCDLILAGTRITGVMVHAFNVLVLGWLGV